MRSGTLLTSTFMLASVPVVALAAAPAEAGHAKAPITRLLGHSTVATHADWQRAGHADAFPFVAARRGQVRTLSLFVDRGSRARRVAVALYTDVAGRPGARLTVGWLRRPVAGRWNGVRVRSAAVASGRRYWIAIRGTGGTLRFRDRATPACVRGGARHGVRTALAASWGRHRPGRACVASVFAAGRAASASGPPRPAPGTAPTAATAPAAPAPAAPATAACTVGATTGSLGSVFAGAGAGAVICLDSGDYGTFSGGSKAGMVTLRPAAGAHPSIGVALGASARNIRFDGFSDFGGQDINGAQNIEIVNSTFTAPMQVRGATAGIVFDNDTFDNLGHGTWEGRLSLAQNAAGVTVRGSHFGNGGCADGIQLNGGAHDVTIQGNTFSGIRQGSCTEHADPIQFYGASDVRILDNYFHDNSTGIMNADGNGSPMVARNNVWVMDEYPYAIAGSGLNSSAISHNVVVGPATISLSAGNAGTGSGNTLRDNVSAFTGTGGNQADHNLTQDNVAFRGGSGRCAYALAAGSAGRGGASDGTDIGLNDCP